MIVLTKRKIRITILIVFFLVFGVTFLNDKKEGVPAVSLPVSGKTVVIDAGHGKPDERGRLLKSEKVAHIRYFKKLKR